MKKVIVSSLLLILTCNVTLAQQRLQPAEQLSLAISAELAQYYEGAPMPVKLTFKNTGKKRTAFTLPGKGKDPPGYIQARVWDRQGRLLTMNDTVEDGWWTVWVLSSSTYEEKESDRVSLRPGEEYSPVIDLAHLLSGCRCLPDGLRAGAYRVQFRLGKVVSNEIEITLMN